jgi:hypothetical protein
VRENKPLNGIKHSCTPPAKSKTLAKVCEGVSDVQDRILKLSFAGKRRMQPKVAEEKNTSGKTAWKLF